jgi:hypothetical protein
MVTSPQDKEVITLFWLSHQTMDGAAPFYFLLFNQTKNETALFSLSNMK